MRHRVAFNPCLTQVNLRTTESDLLDMVACTGDEEDDDDDERVDSL